MDDKSPDETELQAAHAELIIKNARKTSKDGGVINADVDANYQDLWGVVPPGGCLVLTESRKREMRKHLATLPREQRHDARISLPDGRELWRKIRS